MSARHVQTRAAYFVGTMDESTLYLFTHTPLHLLLTHSTMTNGNYVLQESLSLMHSLCAKKLFSLVFIIVVLPVICWHAGKLREKLAAKMEEAV